MNKTFVGIYMAVLGAFASCSNEVNVPETVSGQEVETTISIALPENLVSRVAVPAAYSDPALTSVDVTLFISYKGKIVKTITKADQDLSAGKTVEFKNRLVSGQVYDISAWADLGEGLYDVHTTVGDSAYVALKRTTFKTLLSSLAYNRYDAYFGNMHETISINKTLNLTLKRPFALVVVNTLDWEESSVKEAGIRPDNYSTTFSVPTKMKLIDGQLSSVKDVSVAGYVSEYNEEGAVKELSFDYLFADAVPAILPDFTITYRKDTEVITSYLFQNIPIQRNYKTIITGNILTREGTFEVAVDPAWTTPNHTVDF